MAFDLEAYRAKVRNFPDITYKEFQDIPDDDVRLDIGRKNKVISTDTYNRTMSYIKGPKGRLPEAYTLTFRKSHNGKFLVVNGVRRAVEEALRADYTAAEVDFARDFYAHQKEKFGNGYFEEGMWREVVEKYRGRLPVKVRAVADGTAMLPGEPSIAVASPMGEIAAHLEPNLLHAFYETAVTTDYVVMREAIGDGRVVEAGKRAAICEEDHVRALRALNIAGLRATSNDTGALVVPEALSGGTTAHRFFACYDTELEAMEAAVQKCDRITLLVDLIEPFAGIEKIIKLKKKYREAGKVIYMRLDSGDLAKQAQYALHRLREEGMADPKLDKVSIADVGKQGDLEALDAAVRAIGVDPKLFTTYVTGQLLVMQDKTRNAVSGAYKLTEVNGVLTGKVAAGTGKGAIPGQLNVEIREETKERVIVLEEEPVRGRRLLVPVYDGGELLYAGNDRDALAAAAENLTKTLPEIHYAPSRSAAVEAAIEQVRARFMGQIVEDPEARAHMARFEKTVAAR